MRKTAVLSLLPALIFLSGCYRQAYLLSPFNANTNFYHAKPYRTDSIKSAVYAGGTFSAGGANDGLKDGVYTFHGYAYRSHTFDRIQAYYGIHGSLGSYEVDEYSLYSDYNNNYTLVNPGPKFFSGLGASGGINLVIPMGTRHEWRVIGIESTVQKEFGKYLSLRKGLPDSVANVIDRNSVFASAGLTTEFAFKTRKGAKIGYKIALGTGLNRSYRYYNSYDYHESLVPVYLSHTLQITRDKVTGFGQVNFGSYAANFQMGFAYRLGASYK